MKNIFIPLFLLFFTLNLYSQEDRWGLTVNGGLAIPTGDFSNYYDNGYTFSAGAIYDFKFSTRLSIILGYTRWELNQNEFNRSLEQDSVRFEGTAPISTIPLLLQLKWYGTQERLKLYALIEGGFYFNRSEFSGNVFVADTLIGSISGKESSTNTGINLGLGLSFSISENIEFDFTGKYHIVSVNNSYNFTNTNQSATINSDQFWSLTAGISIILIE